MLLWTSQGTCPSYLNSEPIQTTKLPCGRALLNNDSLSHQGRGRVALPRTDLCDRGWGGTLASDEVSPFYSHGI